MKTIQQLTIDDAEQRSAQWLRSRLGKFTGTRIGAIMTKGKKKDEPLGKTAISMVEEVESELLLDSTIVDDDEFLLTYSQEISPRTRAMDWGVTNEPLARSRYEIETGNKVIEVGMILDDYSTMSACSPDGLVLDENMQISGGIEIKCPHTPSKFIHYCNTIHDGESLKAEEPGYYWQVMQCMSVTGAQWWDFVAYSPRHKAGHDLHIVRIERDEDAINSIHEQLDACLDLIDKHGVALENSQGEHEHKWECFYKYDSKPDYISPSIWDEIQQEKTKTA